MLVDAFEANWERVEIEDGSTESSGLDNILNDCGGRILDCMGDLGEREKTETIGERREIGDTGEEGPGDPVENPPPLVDNCSPSNAFISARACIGDVDGSCSVRLTIRRPLFGRDPFVRESGVGEPCSTILAVRSTLSGRGAPGTPITGPSSLSVWDKPSAVSLTFFLRNKLRTILATGVFVIKPVAAVASLRIGVFWTGCVRGLCGVQRSALVARRILGGVGLGHEARISNFPDSTGQGRGV